MSVPRITVLRGHTTAETGYVVDDYPYGYKLRCKIRYWIETATKGSAKGQQRFVSQTTNPKRDVETWNAPKASTYSTLAFMYVDEIGHVKWTSVSMHLSPVQHHRWRLAGVLDQMTQDEAKLYGVLLAVAERYQPQWTEFEDKVSAVVALIEANGTAPELVNGCITTVQGRTLYIGTDALDVYVATAYERLEA